MTYESSIDLPRSHSLKPGVEKGAARTGDLRLHELLRALPPGIPISVEVPGTPGVSVAEAERYAREAFDTTRSVMAG